tara:strand:+ start:614 stop:1198 length:585 start_codon:yes stop_codon:yes gene_type:complete
MIRKFLLIIFCFSLNSTQANELEKGMFALEMEDYERALYYLSFEAVQGNAIAQYNLGLMYKDGVGVDKDINEALGWFILGSENGHMLSKYALGLLYYHGKGTSINFNKAMNLFLDASFMGHPASQINVGNMYYFGQGVSKNYPKAHMWWSFAKEKGVEAAFNNLTMIENKMSESQILEAQKLYNKCQKTTLPKC